MVFKVVDNFDLWAHLSFGRGQPSQSLPVLPYNTRVYAGYVNVVKDETSRSIPALYALQ